jgi:hypothetical protein
MFESIVVAFRKIICFHMNFPVMLSNFELDYHIYAAHRTISNYYNG